MYTGGMANYMLGLIGLAPLDFASFLCVTILSIVMGIFVVDWVFRAMARSRVGYGASVVSVMIIMLFGLVMSMISYGWVATIVFSAVLLKYMYNAPWSNSMLATLVAGMASFFLFVGLSLMATAIYWLTPTIGLEMAQVVLYIIVTVVALWSAMMILNRCNSKCRAYPIRRLSGE